ncbi:TPA: type II toxin-antitoxin system VapC family toxin [Candidatus Woesearchaeota archaeon]|nr:type II toxin-antitoxin system VapC family toxin [Candidatus Woesearchaeota archaeon]
MTTEYFFDTYAIVELLDKNPAYAMYNGAQIRFTRLNVFEFYFFLLRQRGETAADSFISRARTLTVEYDDRTIAAAAKVKLVNRQISMTDAIGYVTALRLGVKFLTGDKAFKGMRNVEWVR